MALIFSEHLKGQNDWSVQVDCIPDGSHFRSEPGCGAGHFFVEGKDFDPILTTGGGNIFLYDCREEVRILRRKPDDRVFLQHRLPASACHQ